MAMRVRYERKRQRQERVVPGMPNVDEINDEKNWPEWPTQAEKKPNLKPPLGMPPVPLEEEAGREQEAFVTVVSGLPRSGTSMMMQMLVAGGMALATDGQRVADESNPKGYFELEKVKRLPSDNAWLDEARGQAIKVVTPLIPWLPQHCDYRILLMTRDLDEILASQLRMLDRLQRKGARLGNADLKRVMEHQQNQAKRLTAGHRVPTLELNYRDAIEKSAEVAKMVAEFLELDLDINAMVGVVVPHLYRERSLHL